MEKGSGSESSPLKSWQRELQRRERGGKYRHEREGFKGEVLKV